MVRLWRWLTSGPGGHGGKGAGHAARRAKAQWSEDGARGDQDYYHVPGAKNPDRADPPTLDDVEFGNKAEPKPLKKERG